MKYQIICFNEFVNILTKYQIILISAFIAYENFYYNTKSNSSLGRSQVRKLSNLNQPYANPSSVLESSIDGKSDLKTTHALLVL